MPNISFDLDIYFPTQYLMWLYFVEGFETKTITDELKRVIEWKHGRKVEIISKKNLGIKGFGVKFRFIDTGYVKSEVIRLSEE